MEAGKTSGYRIFKFVSLEVTLVGKKMTSEKNVNIERKKFS